MRPSQRYKIGVIGQPVRMQLSEFSPVSVFFFYAAYSKESMPITTPLNFPALYFAFNIRFLERQTGTDWDLS